MGECYIVNRAGSLWDLGLKRGRDIRCGCSWRVVFVLRRGVDDCSVQHKRQSVFCLGDG